MEGRIGKKRDIRKMGKDNVWLLFRRMMRGKRVRGVRKRKKREKWKRKEVVDKLFLLLHIKDNLEDKTRAIEHEPSAGCAMVLDMVGIIVLRRNQEEDVLAVGQKDIGCILVLNDLLLDD